MKLMIPILFLMIIGIFCLVVFNAPVETPETITKIGNALMVESKPVNPIAEAIEWAKRHLLSEAIIRRDAKNLKAIIKQRPVEVCKKQKASRAAGTTDDKSVAAKAPARTG